MPNIEGGKINFVYYSGVQPGRLKGVLQAGETDLRAEPIAQSANVNAIYGAGSTGGFQSYIPGSTFAPLSVLEVGNGYLVDAKQSFDFVGAMPSPSATFNNAAITYLRSLQSSSPSPSPSPSPTPGGASGYRIGTNLWGLADWSPALPLVDAFKTSRNWIPGTTSTWETSNPVPLDANKNATHIPVGAEHIKALMFWDLDFTYPGGEYLLLYSGTANVEVVGATKNVGASVVGREVWNVSGNNNLMVRINRINGNINTQEAISIRNIRFIPAAAEMTYDGMPFSQAYTNKLAPFHAVRFMDWMATNDSTHANWADSTKKADARWTPAPVELCVDLCNILNKDGWICIPHRATDDYITQAATVVRDRLASNLNVIVEYSNEVWNWQFAQSNYALAQGQALWGTDVGNAFMQYLGMRTVQIRRIWRSVWGSQAHRVKVALCAQAGYLGIEDGALNAPNWIASGVGNPVAPKTEIDLYGIAPYFDGALASGDAARTALVASWADQGEVGIAKAFSQLRNGTEFGLGGSFEGIKQWVTYHKNIANSIGKDLVFYECGQHMVQPGNGTQADKDKCVQFFATLNRRPEMGQLYLDYFTYLRDAGVKMPFHFSDISPFRSFGFWGLWENVLQANTPKATAIYQAISTLSGT